MNPLPPALAPWAESLDALTPELAIALGPMIRRLDELVAARDPATAPIGQFDGYGGLSRRGRPDRILASQWLLADELPDEFIRRATAGELLHLAPEYRAARTKGKVVLLADTGPGQAGAARLVQLACLIVLRRRAAAQGAELVLGIVGGNPADWIAGDLPKMARAWLRSRRSQDPAPDDLTARLAALDADDEAWVVGSPALPGRRRTITVAESAWDGDGARAVDVTLSGVTITLPLPDRALAIQALRGRGFLDTSDRPARHEPGPPPAGLRLPAFTSASRRMLLRGEDPSEIYSVLLPEHKRASTPRPYRFEGSVVAASWLGRRLVAVTITGEQAQVHVVGQRISKLDGIRFPAAEADVTEADVADLCPPLQPVYYHNGDLLIRGADNRWREVNPCGNVTASSVIEVAPLPGPAIDTQLTVRRSRDSLWVSGIPGVTRIPPQSQCVLGGGALAVSDGRGQWRIVDARGNEHSVTTADTPIGLVVDHLPALVTLSRGKNIVRVAGPAGVRVLTRWSGRAVPVVHPTLPLIAAKHDDRIVVGHAITGQILATIRAEP